MASGLTGSGTKQGDHVFNDLQTAIERPIDSIRSATNAGLDGRHFLTDYLPHGTDLAQPALDLVGPAPAGDFAQRLRLRPAPQLKQRRA